MENSLSQLYGLLGKFICKKPEQWECWTYLQKWFLRDDIVPYSATSKLQYLFNETRYALCKIMNENYVFDLFSYRIFPISENVYNCLKYSNIEDIEKTDINDLIEINIIV